MKMKSTSLGSIVILGVFVPVSASFASGYDSSASYKVTATATHTFSEFNTIVDNTTPAVHSTDLSMPAETMWTYARKYEGEYYSAPYSALATSDGHVEASNSRLAIAAFGSVGGSASAPSQIGGADPNFISNGAGGQVHFSTEAQFTDTIRFQKLGIPFGKAYTIHSLLRLSGAFQANVGDSGNAFFTLDLVGTSGIPTAPYSGYWARYDVRGYDHSTDVNLKAPKSIPLTLHAFNGGDGIIDVEMRIEGRIQDGYGTVPTIRGGTDGSAFGFYNVDFSHTLLWGGITSVTDDATGEPVDGWTLTSASGFDYSKPAPEPEPASWVLLAIGGATVWRWHRKCLT